MNRARVVVIGGGATGTGILRDLSMRGIPALLVEKADLASGATSRFHGLLHSGARYAVNDPEAARECIAENAILRRIGPFCVEETEGYFVRTPQDDPAFEPVWVEACRACGIEVTRIDVGDALRREPNLTRDALAVYRVPDSAVDGFRLVWHNAMSARRYGGEIRTYCPVTAVRTKNGMVTGVSVLHAKTGKKETIPCEFVINAAGSWAGEVARMAGLSVPVTPDKGTLLAFNHRFAGRVVNRLRKPADGDIFVPHGSITIFGTTSMTADRPDDTLPRSEDALALLRQGEALFPKIREYRMLRAFAGTRPLYSPSSAGGRAATRNFVILDHAADGLAGMITVTGGKLTSYRLMAEKTVDAAAARLGVTAPCRTAKESVIPAPDGDLARRAAKLFPSEGARLAVSRLGDDLGRAVEALENTPWKKLLLCECEMVTLAEFETAASEPTSHSLGDIRRRTRLGMGTCQGGFCALRAAGALAESALVPETPPRDIFLQFVQERWHGIRPLLWGTQLKEIELERGIYGATLNIGAQPGECGAIRQAACGELAARRPLRRPPVPPAGREYDVIVAGAGLAGLVAAAAAAARGGRVLVISAGAGALAIGGGTIDLLGYVRGKPVTGSPYKAMRSLPPSHPYALVGEEAVRASLDFLAFVLQSGGFSMLLAGSEQTGNAWMPTAAGAMKPTWITGGAMNPAALAGAGSFTVLGVTGMKDFSPRAAAAGLKEWQQFAGKPLAHATAPSPFAGVASARDTTALDIAAFIDTPKGIDWLAAHLAALDGGVEAVLLPSILGTGPGSAVHAHLENASGKKIIELFCPPPSVTGLRLRRALMAYLRGRNASFVENAPLSRAVVEKGRCVSLVSSLPDGERHYRAASFVIATGGLFGGGVTTRPGEAREAIFGLPLSMPANQDDWSGPDFFGGPHRFAAMGVSVDNLLRPVSAGGEPLFENVRFAGRSLGGYDFAAEKSGSGVALATGYFAGSAA